MRPRPTAAMDNQLNAFKALLPHLAEVVPSALFVVIAAIAANFILGRSLTLLSEKTRLGSDYIAPFRRVIRWGVTLGALVILLGLFGFNLGGLWGFASTLLAAIAIGFVALWSVLSNFLCTLLILVYHPFAVGDEIEFAGEPVRGKVIDLNFTFTTLRAEDGFLLQVPNSLFFQKVIKRRPGNSTISLAAQLQSREPAKV